MACCCKEKDKKEEHSQGNNPLGPNGSGSINPNPAIPGVELKYQLPEGVVTGELRIVDTQGRLIKTVMVGNAFDHIQLDTGSLATGTYYYQLFVDGKSKDGATLLLIQ